MRPEELRANSSRDEPHSRKRHAANSGEITLHAFFPARKVNRPGERGQHHELREGQVRLVGQRRCGLERLRTVAGQTENERPEHVYSMTTKGTKALCQACSHAVEILIYILQPFG